MRHLHPFFNLPLFVERNCGPAALAVVMSCNALIILAIVIGIWARSPETQNGAQFPEKTCGERND
jgi:hypothetical protein